MTGTTLQLILKNVNLKIKKCQEQISKNYWMQVSISVT